MDVPYLNCAKKSGCVENTTKRPMERHGVMYRVEDRFTSTRSGNAWLGALTRHRHCIVLLRKRFGLALWASLEQLRHDDTDNSCGPTDRPTDRTDRPPTDWDTPPNYMYGKAKLYPSPYVQRNKSQPSHFINIHAIFRKKCCIFQIQSLPLMCFGRKSRTNEGRQKHSIHVGFSRS